MEKNSSSESAQEDVAAKDAIRTEQAHEDAIRALTETLLDAGQLGVNAPLVYERIGMALYNLYQMATCGWGCRQGDHIAENLLRRFYNSACAALRLMVSGLYDESLGTVRVMAELVNLLQAFDKDKDYFDKWKTSSPKQRSAKFSPFQVRLYLEKLGLQSIVDKEIYAKLCENGIHVSPASLFLSHDFEAALYAGGHFAIPGVFLILNTSAWIVGPFTLIAARLVEVPKEKYQMLREAAINLLYVAQGLKIDNYEENFLKIRAEYLHQRTLKEISEMDEQKWEALAVQLEHELKEQGKEDKLNKMSEEDMRVEFGSWAYHQVSRQLHRRLQEQNLKQTVEASRVALTQKMIEGLRRDSKPE